MSKYKKIMLDKGVMQKDILDSVRRVDVRVDKSLLSKIVNDVCLPNKPTLESICKTLSCGVLDLYDAREIYLPQETAIDGGGNAVATARIDRGGKSHGDNIYNLTVEIPRDVAERVFSKSALRELGYANKTEAIRHAIDLMDESLSIIFDAKKPPAQ